MNAAGPDFLQAFLEGHDIACPGCGYNLRDLRGSHCPECGDELRLQVGLVEPRQAAPIVGLVGLAAGAGLSGLLLGYYFIRRFIFHDQFMSVEHTFFVLNLGGLLLEGAAMLLWLRSWRRVRQLTPTSRWLLVAGCWGLTLANLLIFTVFVK